MAKIILINSDPSIESITINLPVEKIDMRPCWRPFDGEITDVYITSNARLVANYIYNEYLNFPSRLSLMNIKDRWPEVEPILKSIPEYACYYASQILKRRWIEAESVIMTDPWCAYLYAKELIMDRWPEAEPIIMTDPTSAYCYERDVIKGEWPEAKSIIKKMYCDLSVDFNIVDFPHYSQPLPESPTRNQTIIVTSDSQS